jgi:arylsulfatase A-like enzyme
MRSTGILNFGVRNNSHRRLSRRQLLKRKVLSLALTLLILLIALLLLRIYYFGDLDGSRKLNVVLITLDTTRPDHLGCYGYKDASTPNIDRLAEQAVIFTQAIAPIPITLPSHCSMLTGLDVFSLGIRENGTFYLTDNFTTLAEILKKNGYKTAAVTGSFVLDSRFGLEQGFDFERPAGEVSNIAINWLKNNYESNFFLWVHFFDPHVPYNPPQKYKLKNERRRHKLYDGEIAYADYELGKILDELKRKKLLDSTLIIIASDHGEMLGEHVHYYNGRRYNGHGHFTYEEEIRAALIVKLPDVIPKVKQIPQMVKLSDITPTILDVLKIKEKIKFDGKSLRPLIVGNSTRNLTELYCETMLPYLRSNRSSVRALRTEKQKIIYLPEEETVLLYDIVKDREEQINLFDKKSKDHVDLFNKLLSYVKKIDSKQANPTRTMDEETIEKLRSLGYLK